MSLALGVLFSGCLTARSDTRDASKITLEELKFHTNLSLAFEDAKAQNKPVFVYANSEYCHWCKVFEEESLANKSIIDRLNENFISVSIDVDKQKYETRNFRVIGTPTEIFLGPNGAEIKRIRGYVDNGTFLKTINELAN